MQPTQPTQEVPSLVNPLAPSGGNTQALNGGLGEPIGDLGDLDFLVTTTNSKDLFNQVVMINEKSDLKEDRSEGVGYFIPNAMNSVTWSGLSCTHLCNIRVTFPSKVRGAKAFVVSSPIQI